MTEKKATKKKIPCVKCGTRKLPRVEKGMCLSCYRETAKECSRCKKPFLPRRPRQRNCLKCFKKGKSVWISSSAGLPGLGRNR